MKKVSDLLRETREEKKITLDYVEQKTKIKKEFLHAIEKGEFNKLPSENYALGFVKNYARFLGLPLTKTMPLFRREHKSKQFSSIIPEFRKTQREFNRKIFLNFKAIFIFAASCVVFAYVFFQYSSLIFSPKLEIENPKNGATISGNVIEVKGKTDPYAAVKIEGDDAYVTLQGNFKKSIYAFSGERTIEIIAKNRFGKESKKVINVRVR